MKRWRLPLLLVVLAAFAGGLIWHFMQQHERNKREAHYQSLLHSYKDDFQPGMNREQVENSLHAKGIRFSQMCCFDEEGAYTDFVLIDLRKEDVPWYCSEVSVFIELQFDGSDSSPDPSDSLKKVELTSRGEGCL